MMQVRVHNPEGRPAPTDGPLGIRRGGLEENPCTTCGMGVPPTPSAHMSSTDRRAWALQQVRFTNPAEEETGCIETIHRVNIPGVVCREVAPPPHPDPRLRYPRNRFFCCPQEGYYFLPGGSSCPDDSEPAGSFISLEKRAVLVCRHRDARPATIAAVPQPPSPVTAGGMFSSRRGKRAIKQQLAVSGALATPERVRNCSTGSILLEMQATDPQGYQHMMAREQNPAAFPMLNNLAPIGPPSAFNPGAPPSQVFGVGPISSTPMGAIHNPTFWPGGPRGNPS